MSTQILTDMLRLVSQHREAIDARRILPRVAWNR
jgi:hypothetical protein